MMTASRTPKNKISTLHPPQCRRPPRVSDAAGSRLTTLGNPSHGASRRRGPHETSANWNWRKGRKDSRLDRNGERRGGRRDAKTHHFMRGLARTPFPPPPKKRGFLTTATTVRIWPGSSEGVCVVLYSRVPPPALQGHLPGRGQPRPPACLESLTACRR